MGSSTLAIHAFSVFAMTGVIWMVQLLNYPQMRLADPRTFQGYHARHASRIAGIVGPAMLTQALTAFLLFAQADAHRWLYAALTAIVIASTAFFSVPMHTRLSKGFDPEALARLIRTNWIRTAAWSIHAVLLLTRLCGLANA